MVSIPWLDPNDIHFPASDQALKEPNGLIAAGGDLSSERLIHAYHRGIFPWYSEGQPILWWSPDPRLVLYPDRLHISRSLRKVLKQKRFQVSADQQFNQVLHLCAAPRKDEHGTWITAEMADAYLKLHQLGYAHSVEVWLDNELVGGLYGVALGRVFFGESMFSMVANASKVALVHLCGQLQAWEFHSIDCQVESPHLVGLGAINIPRRLFERELAKYTNIPANMGDAVPLQWNMTWQFHQ